MDPDLMILLHEILCLALLWTVFCRSVQCCSRVFVDVRLAFWCLGVIACLGIVAPLAWGFIPDLFSLGLIAAVTIVQVVTAQHWANGIPRHFIKDEHHANHC